MLQINGWLQLKAIPASDKGSVLGKFKQANEEHQIY